ncbi:MAG: polysaccharide deacetylase family protein [Acidimicrobiia bacterium]|nr:polysaccharide deacetylase family protein [Acidimicrobiia bacterium]
MDDDYKSHAEHVLPVLQRHNVPATFFLSGRWLHGLGAYWWEKLEDAIAARGLDEVCLALGVPAGTADELAIRLERDLAAQSRVEELCDFAGGSISEDWFKPLFESGMGIGFHTLHHPRLTLLDDEGLEQALSLGLAELAETMAARPFLFAYPHGRAGRREASAVQDAGFTAAFTTSKDPVGADSDRYLVGRWEPGASTLRDFAAELAWRLHAPIQPISAN